MKALAFAVLTLSSAAANAQVYKCPQLYPGKDAPGAVLTGASMMWGELHGDGYLHGDDETAMGGHDLHYGFADDEQGWLVCAYGGAKRIKGKFRDGQEWGQAMSFGGLKWWMKLAPKAGNCTVKLREISASDPGKRTWTATAICKGTS
jgi:hypothetical protein